MKLVLIRRKLQFYFQLVDKLILKQLVADTLKGIKYNVLIQELSEHYDPPPSFIVQRFKNSTKE